MTSYHENPSVKAAIDIMGKLTDDIEWYENRRALYDKNGDFVGVIPSNVAWSGVAELKKRFDLEDKAVTVKVTVEKIHHDNDPKIPISKFAKSDDPAAMVDRMVGVRAPDAEYKSPGF